MLLSLPTVMLIALHLNYRQIVFVRLIVVDSIVGRPDKRRTPYAIVIFP